MTTITTMGRDGHMDYTQLPAILAGVGAFLATLAGGAKWMLTRVDKKDADERAWQVKEREKLEAQFALRIDALVDQVRSQEDEISRMRSDLTMYVRHVGVLEGLLKANGIEAPPLVKVGL